MTNDTDTDLKKVFLLLACIYSTNTCFPNRYLDVYKDNSIKCVDLDSPVSIPISVRELPAIV